MMKKLTALVLIMVMLTASTAFAWSCPGCGQDNNGNFCPNCGTKRPAELICEACGANHGEQKFTFCPDCGHRLGTPAAEAAPVQTEAPTAVPTAVPAPEPTEAPTEAPTAEPTAEPTAVPAPTSVPVQETYTFRSRPNGTVVVIWDAGKQGPCQVRFLPRQQDTAEQDLNAPDSLGYSMIETDRSYLVLDKLVPGQSYWIGVFDSQGQGNYQPYDPEAAEPFTALKADMICYPLILQDGATREAIGFTPADAVNAQQECGVFLAFRYNNTGKECELLTQMVLEIPGGQQLVMYTADAVFTAYAEDVTGWEFVSLSPYFHFLAERLGGVPAGEYRITVYLDGEKAGSQPFMVAGDEQGLMLGSLDTQPDGSVQASWIGGTAPYTVRYVVKRSDDYEADVNHPDGAGRWVDVADCMDNTHTLRELVPGVSYWISVLDANGEGRYKAYIAPAAGAYGQPARAEIIPMAQSANGTAQLSSLPVQTAGLADDTEHGAFIRFYYDNLGEAHPALFQMVFTLPNGATLVTYAQMVELTTGRDCWLGWDFCSTEWYLATMRERFGSLTPGDIQVDFYLDGKLAASGILPLGSGR